jgi:hypothetical protein
LTNPALSPSFLPTATFPTLPLAQLTDQESQVANFLAMRLFDQQPYLQLSGLYYDGLQKMQDLGISIPPSLASLRTVVGWPKIGIDALDERLCIEGFRYPGATEVDDDLAEIWQSNNMDSEHTLINLDALIYGRSYIVVGLDEDGQAVMTGESPLNLTALWDARMRAVTAALQIYLDTDFTSDMYGQEVAALYLPGHTIHMARNATSGGAPLGARGQWEIFDRDNHGFQQVPVVRVANRQRLGNRDGLSEISTEWRNQTDIGCRTALAMDIGREFHAAPRRYILGASEANFQKADGTAVSAWETYMSKIWAVERDENGEIPQVGEFKASDPSTYTKLLDECRKEMSGLTGLPPHYFGLSMDGNPPSADAIRANEARLERRAKRKQTVLSDAYEDAMRLAVLIRDGVLPEAATRIEAEWMDPATPTPAATADALTKYMAEGAIPPTSDVTLKRAGFSATERAQLAQDRAASPGQEFLAEIQSEITGKQITALHRLLSAMKDQTLEDPAAAAEPAAPPAI